MRLKYSKLCTFIIVAVNMILVYFTWKLVMVPLILLKPKDNSVSSSLSSSEMLLNVDPVLLQQQNQQQLQQPSSLDDTTSIMLVKPVAKPKDRIQSANKHIKKMITIIFRDFYHFENDLKASIDSVLTLIPNIQVIVVYDKEPYPPLENFANYSTKTNIRFLNLAYNIHRTTKQLSPFHLIKTKFILLLPDSVRLGGRSIIQKMLKEAGNLDSNSIVGGGNSGGGGGGGGGSATGIGSDKKINSKKMVIVPFSSNIKTFSNCCKINLNFANWTVEYMVKNGTENCDMFIQKHAILMETNTIKDMPDALAAPFPEMLYIQSKITKTKKLYLNSSLQDGKRLFTAFHNKQRKKEIRRQQFKSMYKKIQIKKVIRKMTTKNQKFDKQKHKHRTGVGVGGGGIGGNGGIPAGVDDGKSLDTIFHHQIDNNNNNIILTNTTIPLVTTIEYYGCERNSKSCIGPVYNAKPFFVYLDKHTPPCCADKIKSVFHHVMEEFENVGIRYWLDNQALKSAIDTNGLSSDAYEIDISFNTFDLERSVLLKKCQTKPLIDSAGFYWIKATDGHYFRVQYSKINQLGVNLLPFDIQGDHVVPNGFYGWKARQFLSEFLHPMSTVLFLGKNVMCPNNVQEFLDLKNIK